MSLFDNENTADKTIRVMEEKIYDKQEIIARLTTEIVNLEDKVKSLERRIKHLTRSRKKNGGRNV